MSHVPNFRYDLFVSYASADNLPAPQTGEWVTGFVHDLEIALTQRLGGSDDLSMYFDQRSLAANQTLEELLAAVDDSACFLSVCSRSYIQRDWTTRELEHFCADGTQQNRLFVVETLPLETDEPYPDLLADRHRLPFFRRSSKTQVAVPYSRTDPEYGLLIHDLAEQIRVQLMAMRTVSGFREVATMVEDDVQGRKQVLLGQVTEDLDTQRDELRRYLEQFDHRVFPTQPYRQDGSGFQDDLAADLSRADLFVQLLGPVKRTASPGFGRRVSTDTDRHGQRCWRSDYAMAGLEPGP